MPSTFAAAFVAAEVVTPADVIRVQAQKSGRRRDRRNDNRTQGNPGPVAVKPLRTAPPPPVPAEEEDQPSGWNFATAPIVRSTPQTAVVSKKVEPGDLLEAPEIETVTKRKAKVLAPFGSRVRRLSEVLECTAEMLKKGMGARFTVSVDEQHVLVVTEPLMEGGTQYLLIRHNRNNPSVVKSGRFMHTKNWLQNVSKLVGPIKGSRVRKMVGFDETKTKV